NREWWRYTRSPVQLPKGLTARIPYGESLVFENPDGSDGAVLRYVDGTLSVSYGNDKAMEI
ncbi:MAG: hypothetical protein ACRDCI_08980, partial [Plesiomonas shigelloides]